MIPKTYVYKVYRNGKYLGNLPEVISEFKVSQDINTPGAPMSITIGRSANIAPETVPVLLTEEGQPLITEDGLYIYADMAQALIGEDDNSLVRENNDLRVYEYSRYYPNGLLAFSGYMSSIEAQFTVGGSNIVIGCISDGIELDNDIIQAGGYTLDIDQPIQNIGYGFATEGPFEISKVAQTFKPSVSGNLAKISLYMQCIASVQDFVNLEIGLGTPDAPTSILYSGTNLAVANAGGYTWVDFAFPSIFTVAGAQHYFKIEATTPQPSGGSGTFFLGATSAQPYIDGTLYVFSNGVGWSTQTFDATFRTYTSGGSIVTEFEDVDPSDMVRVIIDDYRSRGGKMNYDSSSIDDTGKLESYTFTLNTPLEGIKKGRDLAPSNWYWYGDVASGLVHLHAPSETPDHSLLLGVHIESLKIKSTIERVINDVYFTGGDLGDNTNLFIRVTSPSGLAANNNRRGLARPTDGRVKRDDTATTLAQNLIDENSGKVYESPVRVLDAAYDTALIKLGHIINFPNIGGIYNFINLQVVRVARDAEGVDLTLGVPPRRLSTKIEQIRRELTEVQTVDNPAEPS